MGEARRQAAGVQLVELDELQQVVELGDATVEGEDLGLAHRVHDGRDLRVQDLAAALVGEHEGARVGAAVSHQEDPETLGDVNGDGDGGV